MKISMAAGWTMIVLSILTLLAFGTFRISEMSATQPLLDAFGIRYVEHPWIALIHILPGLLFITLAPFQFVSRLRKRHLRVHRFMGRLLVICAAISGLFALVAAFRLPAYGGIATMTATVFFGLIFLFSLSKAFLHIRRKRVAQHREWMIRTFGLALGVASIRMYIGLFQALFALSFDDVFAACFWLGLSTNLVIAEVWIQLTRKGPARGRVPQQRLQAE